MTTQERRNVVAKLAEHRRELLSIVYDHDEAWFSQRSKEGDRTRKGMLKHICESEHNYIWVWAKRARDEDNPILRPSSRPSGLFDEALRMSLAELCLKLTEQRMRTIEFIAETSDEEMERPILGTGFGPLTVKQCTKFVYRHDRMHIEEMLGLPQTYDARIGDRRL